MTFDASAQDLNTRDIVDPSFDAGAIVDAVDAQAHEAGSDVPPPPAELAELLGPITDPSPEAASGEAPTPSGPLDEAGEVFDPAIHATDESGEPKKTKAGKWAKKRGRKSKEAQRKASAEASSFSSGYSPPQNNAAENQTGPNTDALKRAQERLETGKTMANLTVLASVMAGGEDFAADNKELEQMGAAYAAYLEARGIDAAMSPEMVLAGQLSNYFLPRVFKPKVKDRFKFGFKWIKEKVFTFGAKVKARGFKKKSEEKEEKSKPDAQPPQNMPEWPF